MSDEIAIEIDSDKVLEYKNSINIENTNEVLNYGVKAQNNISKFSDTILTNTRNKDTNEIGSDLTKLTFEIQSLDNKNQKSLFNFFKKTRDNRKISAIDFDNVCSNVDKIVESLEVHQRTLLKDINMLETMYETNKEYYKDLSLYIIAGEEKLKEYREVDIENQKKILETEATETNLIAQKLNDMENTAIRFEKKLHDLSITKTISLQMAPQIRLLQNNNSVLVEKIQSSIVNSIPLWKNHIVIALGLENSKKALEAQTMVTDMTNELLLKNSELLKTGSVEIAKESERSVVSVETLKQTNENLIIGINEILEIQKNGQQERMNARIELEKIEEDLKKAVLSSSAVAE